AVARLRDAPQGRPQRPRARRPLYAEQVAQGVGQVHAHQRSLRAVEPPAGERQVHLEAGAVPVSIQTELAELALHAVLADALHRALGAQAVVVPARASTDTAKAVRCCSSFTGTICGSSRRARCCSSIGTQMMPLVWRIMKATAAGVTRSAAMMRSPSFSRSSSSMMTTMRPARSSARISAMELSAGACGAGAPLPVNGRILDMVRRRVIRQLSIPERSAPPRAPTHAAQARPRAATAASAPRQRQQPREVARYLVDLEVHARARAQAPEGGRRAGVGNEVDAEARPL